MGSKEVLYALDFCSTLELRQIVAIRNVTAQGQSVAGNANQAQFTTHQHSAAPHLTERNITLLAPREGIIAG